MKRFSLLFFLTLIVPSIFLRAADPTARVRTEVDPSEFHIGDRVKYRIDVEFQDTMIPLEIHFSTPQPNIEVLSQSAEKPQPQPEGKLKQTHIMTLTAFSTGTINVPGVVIPFQLGDGSRVEARTQPMDLTVKSLLEEWGDKGGLQPLKGFFNFKDYFWLWVFLGGLALAGLLFFLWKKRRDARLKDPAFQKNIRPPEEVFWEAIQRCEDEDLVKSERAREFYSALSSALKAYLEGQFGMDALDRTTSELMAEVKKVQLEPPLPSHIKRFLETGDLVKFAKLIPPQSELEGDYLRIKEVASKTGAPKEEKENSAAELPV